MLKNAKFGLIILAVSLALVGLISTELMQQQYVKEQEKLQNAQTELEKLAPEKLKTALEKLLSAQTIELTDKQTLEVIGCEYTNTYNGKHNGEEEFAHNTTDFQNNSFFKDICPTDYTQLMTIYNEQIYWTKDKTYKKRNTESDFIEQATGSSQLITRPSEYLSKYFKAYQEFPKIQKTTKNGDNLRVEFTTEADTTKTIFHATITPENTIREINYQINNENTSSSTTFGEIKINYTPQEIRPPNFQAGLLDKNWIKEKIQSLDTTITLTYQGNLIKIDGKSKELKASQADLTKNDYSCKLQTQTCFDQYQRAIQVLNDYINDSYTEIKTGECLKLRVRTINQINDPKRLLTLKIEPANTNNAYNEKLEIETDTVNGQTVITKYGSNFTCYETQIPYLTSRAVFENIMTRAKID